MRHLKINEIFYSIQGESLAAGLPCVFVRLTGCNLRCTFCDTTYAYQQGQTLEIAEIINRVASYGCRSVLITGGEPLLQENTPVLIESLLDQKFKVWLETNGSFDISPISNRCVRIVDIKCPSSGEEKSHDPQNISRLSPHDQLKFVIADRDDYDFAVKFLPVATTIAPANILFSTASGQLAPSLLASWMLDDGLSARLHLQLHKIIWGEERGR